MSKKQQKGCYWCSNRKKAYCKARSHPLLNGHLSEGEIEAYKAMLGTKCVKFEPNSKMLGLETVIFT